MFSSGDGGWGVVDDYALSCIYGHLRGGQRDQLRDLNDPYAVIVDTEPLLPYPVDLLGVEHLDLLDELVQHPGRQLAGAGVFADQGDEHIRGHGLAALLVDLGAERLDFLRQLLLLLLVPPRHTGEAVIRELAGNIVLIDPFKQAVQLLIAGLQGLQFLLLQLSIGGLCLLGVADHSLHKLILKLAGKLGQPPDFSQHHLLQEVHADVMGGSAAPTIALVVGAVEILDVGVALIEMEVQVVSAIGTDQKAGEHIAFSLMGAALADLSALLLDLLKDCPLNDRFVDIFEYHPVLPIILQALFILVRFGVGLKVQNVAAILLQGQYFCDAGTVPLRRGLFFPFAGPLNTFFEPVGTRCQDTILLKTCRNLLRSIPLQGHTVNPAYHLGRFLVHNPVFGIVRVLAPVRIHPSSVNAAFVASSFL